MTLRLEVWVTVKTMVYLAPNQEEQQKDNCYFFGQVGESLRNSCMTFDEG